jgi:O-antigen/teichoic acid export membrane protein
MTDVDPPRASGTAAPEGRLGRLVALLPKGATVIGISLGVQGLTTYGFLIIAARALGPARYSPFSVLWALTFVAAPGIFLPLEQEVGRAASARRVRGFGAGPLVVRAALVGGGMAAAVMVLAGAGSGPLISRLFDGQGLLFLGFLVAMPSYAAYYLARGTVAGAGRFRAYASILLIEGAVRVAAAAGLWIVGVRNAGVYSLAIAIPCLVAIAIVLPRQRGVAAHGPAAPWNEISVALGWLLTGALLSQLLLNVAPLAVQALFSRGNPTAAGRVLNGLIIARVPLFLFQGIQAALMPKLAADATAGRMDDFRATLRRLLILVAGLVVVSVVGMALLGPPLLQILFGHRFVPLGRLDLALLALGSESMMAALVLAYACIALGGYRGAAMGWVAGTVGVVTALVILPGSLLRVEMSFCVGVGAACAVMAWALRRRMAGREAGNPPATPEAGA